MNPSAFEQDLAGPYRGQYSHRFNSYIEFLKKILKSLFLHLHCANANKGTQLSPQSSRAFSLQTVLTSCSLFILSGSEAQKPFLLAE